MNSMNMYIVYSVYGNILCILKSANELIHSLDTWYLGKREDKENRVVEQSQQDLGLGVPGCSVG